ncbi:MAG: beta-ketoacyl-ACP synthase II [Verrucomicrobiota bacterium]
MTERRVVLTGMGAVSPLGNDWTSSWERMKNGESGVSLIESFDVEAFTCKIGGEVRDYEAAQYFANPKEARRVDRYTALSMGAAKMAMADSGLDAEAVDQTRVGVMMGSGIGGLATLETSHRTYLEKGPARVSPFTIPMMISNIASGLISMEYGFGGPNMSIVTACATANNSVGEAWRMIKFGDADAFICGGSEASFTPMGISGFGNMKALSTRNGEPERASRPFDAGRDGFVMGEGAGAMVIEELEHAKARGANILVELAGYGVSADAFHMSAPSPDGTGPARAMAMALKHAQLNPEEVDYLNAHGTSTPLGDIAETKAMKLAFGEHAKGGLMVSSTKSMTGHLLGAAGAIELAAIVSAVRDGVVPPTINLEEPDPECDLDYVPNVARETEVRVAMSNGFGFGGHNATLVVKKFEG